MINASNSIPSAHKSIPVIITDARTLLHEPASGMQRVVVIGNFDGVHCGHQALFKRAVQLCTREPKLTLTALTFEPHPALFFGQPLPPRLTSVARKLELFGRVGVQSVVIQPFDREFASLSPSDFVETILVQCLHTHTVIVGKDFRFGAQRAGDLPSLYALADHFNFYVEAQDLAIDQAGVYSSTRVRLALINGNVSEATSLLGRPHSVCGKVCHGDGRGRTIGVPTANLNDVDEALPARGVYSVVCDLYRPDSNGSALALARGIANVGVRPTVSDERQTKLEVHLFELPKQFQDLYDCTLRIHFIDRIRDERRFESIEALRTQIALDIQIAQQATASMQPPHDEGWF